MSKYNDRRYRPEGLQRKRYRELVANISKKRTEIKKRQERYKPSTIRNVSVNFAPYKPITLKRGFANKFEFDLYFAELQKEAKKSATQIMNQNIDKYRESWLAAFDASFERFAYDPTSKNDLREFRALLKAMTRDEFLRFVQTQDVGKIDFWYKEEDAVFAVEQFNFDMARFLEKNKQVRERLDRRRELGRERTRRYRERLKNK